MACSSFWSDQTSPQMMNQSTGFTSNQCGDGSSMGNSVTKCVSDSRRREGCSGGSMSPARIAARIRIICVASFQRTQRLQYFIFVILLVGNIVLFFRMCTVPESREFVKDLKHGFINTFPEHHFTFRISSGNAKDTLTSRVPPVVHYAWCGKSFFQYKHYLSVLSAYKILRPTQIIFHYEYLPQIGRHGYFQFYENLLRDLPSFSPEPLEQSEICAHEIHDSIGLVNSLMDGRGGFFIGTSVVLSENILKSMNEPLSAFHPVSQVAEKALFMIAPDIFNESRSHIPSPITCPNEHSFTFQNDPCLVTESDFYPADVFKLGTDFGSLARLLAYGRRGEIFARTVDTPIPNIVHYVWFGDRVFSFFNYLSLLSALYIQKADTVYIHGDIQPKGEYWDKAKAFENVIFLQREFPSSVFGTWLQNPSHASDIIRAYALLRYGGVYTDWDFLWVKELSNSQRYYDTLACVDWPKTGYFPDVLNLGILVAHSQSTFLKFFIESYRHYIEKHWGYNALDMVYKVFEEHPDTLHIDYHLQVICYRRKCHPAWKPGFKQHLLMNTHIPFDWRTETNGVHWTLPEPGEFSDLETLKTSSGMFAEIGQNVLKQAGLL